MTKYFILILIALFFTSTTELCDKEAEQNYNTENHTFIVTDNYISNIAGIEKHKSNTNTFAVFSLGNYPVNLNFNVCSFFNKHTIHIPPLINRHIYLDNESFLI